MPRRWVSGDSDKLALLAYLLNGCFCLLIAWTAWQMYLSYETPFQLPRAPSGVALDAARDNTPAIDLQTIAAAHLFGQAALKKRTKPALQFVPETKLHLKLTGIAVVPSTRQSQAIISASDKPAKLYSLGGTLTGGAVIHEITPRYVVIRRNGKYETLWLARDRPTNHKQHMIRIKKDRSVGGVSSVNGVNKLQPQGQQHVELSGAQRKSLNAARAAVFNHDTPISQFVTLQAIYKTGHLRGYRVFPGAKPSDFKALGLRGGDLVVQVDGMALRQSGNRQKIVNALAHKNRMTLTVARGNQRQLLKINLSPAGQ